MGRTRYRLPLDPGLARKWDALSELMDVRVVASGTRPRRALPSRPAPPTRRAELLYGAAVGRRRRAALVPARRRDRRERVRGGGGRAGRAARPLACARRGRGARRLARVVEPLRLAGPRAPAAREQCRRGVRGRPRRRPPRGLGIHRLDARVARAYAARRLHDLLRPHGFRRADRPGPGRPARALRRRPRALQERRGARRGLAPRLGCGARRGAAPGRPGNADGGGRGARPRRSEVGPAARAAGARPRARRGARAPAPVGLGRPSAGLRSRPSPAGAP